MQNLAGVKKADEYIQEELLLAGIDIIKGEPSKGEVPYSMKGKLRDWDFERALYYWVASAQDGMGLPLDVATELHDRKYPVIGEKQPTTYGQVIWVAGHCGCPPPKAWAFPTHDTLAKELERLEIDNINYRDLAELCNNGTIKHPRFVNLYHIDSQLGLNEFARVLKEL